MLGRHVVRKLRRSSVWSLSDLSVLFVKLALISSGIVTLIWRPSAAWIEEFYVNGFYPIWERSAATVSRPFPFALGDVLAIVLVGLIAAVVVLGLRTHSWKRSTLTLFAIAGFVGTFYQISWGWNYDRAPLESHLDYNGGAVSRPAVEALRKRVISELNLLAPRAHALSAEPLPISTLHSNWLPVVQRLGDNWTPVVGPPKQTLTAPLLALNGTMGYMNAFTLEVQLAPDELWFERPFYLAHEWSHAAGFAREDEANYIAAITCIRSKNPVIEYSGWMELFFYLPWQRFYAKNTFSQIVWSDFNMIRKRNASHVNNSFANFTWNVYYKVYLQANHVSSVSSYNNVIRLMLSIPLDSKGLPVAK